MTDAELLGLAQRLLPGSSPCDRDTVERWMALPGAYLLLVRLDVPVQVARGTVRGDLAGHLIYAGSARGPGGSGARLRRHFRRDKRNHWHVDEVTSAASHLVALAVPEGAECDLIDRLLGSGLFEPALPGFGSSDCRRCAAHLLQPTR